MIKFWMDSKSIEDEVIQIQSRSMSDPPLSDIDFENRMAWVRTKDGCVFSMVIRSKFRIRQYRDDHHREDESHFTLKLKILN